MKITAIVFILLSPFFLIAQSYTSYFTGNASDSIAFPLSGICMMGGATENDSAMVWFLKRCKGGDVLVLRASGSDGYNDYLYSELGISVNSVESIVFNQAAAANEPYIHQKIRQAEGIWFAGGDQWDYVSYWRNTPIDSLINDAIKNRNIVIGGTSAGMAILGSAYFTAKKGTVTSSEALSNPYNTKVQVDTNAFIVLPWLKNIITDTHYDNPSRKGRHIAFIARILTDFGIETKGIACEEYTAVCITPDGIASVYGSYPLRQDKAYFIQANCEENPRSPENCSAGEALTWNRNQKALKVFAVNGTKTGSNYFDLNDWQTGSAGNWENWYVNNGILATMTSVPINCSGLSVDENPVGNSQTLYPNPANDIIQFTGIHPEISQVEIICTSGKIIRKVLFNSTLEPVLNIGDLQDGMYFMKVHYLNQTTEVLKFIKIAD